MIFSIDMGADYSFYVESIATYAPAFLGYNNSVLARVTSGRHVFVPISEEFEDTKRTYRNLLTFK